MTEPTATATATATITIPRLNASCAPYHILMNNITCDIATTIDAINTMDTKDATNTMDKKYVKYATDVIDAIIKDPDVLLSISRDTIVRILEVVILRKLVDASTAVLGRFTDMNMYRSIIIKNMSNAHVSTWMSLHRSQKPYVISFEEYLVNNPMGETGNMYHNSKLLIQCDYVASSLENYWNAIIVPTYKRRVQQHGGSFSSGRSSKEHVYNNKIQYYQRKVSEGSQHNDIDKSTLALYRQKIGKYQQKIALFV